MMIQVLKVIHNAKQDEYKEWVYDIKESGVIGLVLHCNILQMDDL